MYCVHSNLLLSLPGECKHCTGYGKVLLLDNLFLNLYARRVSSLLTLSAHVWEGFSSHFICLSCSDFGDYWQYCWFSFRYKLTQNDLRRFIVTLFQIWAEFWGKKAVSSTRIQAYVGNAPYHRIAIMWANNFFLPVVVLLYVGKLMSAEIQEFRFETI